MQLIRGDCLEEMRKIPDGSIDLVLTDPPYGTTRNKWDTPIPLEQMWNELWRLAKYNCAVVITAQSPFDKMLGASNIETLKYEWIWRKRQGTGHLNAKKMPMKNHENILVFYRNLPTYNPQMTVGKPYVCKSGRGSTNYGEQFSVTTKNTGERYPLSVIEFDYCKDKLHPTQKPVALMEYLIKTYTNECETVLDFTMGSGTTGVACKTLNRNFIGIEIDETYFNIAQQRINSHPA